MLSLIFMYSSHHGPGESCMIYTSHTIGRPVKKLCSESLYVPHSLYYGRYPVATSPLQILRAYTRELHCELWTLQALWISSRVTYVLQSATDLWLVMKYHKCVVLERGRYFRHGTRYRDPYKISFTYYHSEICIVFMPYGDSYGF